MTLMKNSFLRMAAPLAVLAGLLLSGCELLEEPLELPPGEPSDLTLDQLVRKMQEATDPQGKYKDASSYILRQKVLSDRNGDKTESSLEIKFKAPSSMKYTSFKDRKATSIVVFDGQKAWNIDPDTGKSTVIPEGMRLDLVKVFAEFIKPGNTVKNIFSKVDVDMVKEDRHSFYRLVCRTENSKIAPYIMYIGANDFLTKRFETTLYSDGSKFPYVSVTGKYVWIEGIRMASETTVSVAGNSEHSSLESFLLNPEIPDSEFQLPVPWYVSAESKEAEAKTPAK